MVILLFFIAIFFLMFFCGKIDYSSRHFKISLEIFGDTYKLFSIVKNDDQNKKETSQNKKDTYLSL